MPDSEPIVATPGDPELQVPPVVPSLNVVVVAGQTDDGPVMAPGNGLTVSRAVTVQPVPNE